MRRALHTFLATVALALIGAPAVESQTVPGLVAGTGNDETLELLYSLEAFQALDPSSLPYRLYFDPYRGNDATGVGSIVAPFRSFAKMKELCSSNVRCTVLGADRVFSPLTLRLTSIVPGENYQKGETVTWDGGGSSGTVLDWFAPDKILVIDLDTGSPPVDGEANLVGGISAAAGDIFPDQGILNTVGGHVVYTFPPAAIDAASGTITISGHSYGPGEGPMRIFSNGALPAGLAPGTDYYICYTTTSTFRLDDDASCTSPIASLDGAGSGMHGIAGALNARVDDPIEPDCSDPDRICVLFESLDPAHPAVIDGNRFHATGYDNRTAPGVFGQNPDYGLAFVSGSGAGWVGWQNIRVQNIAIDAFSNASANAGKLITLNSPARDIRNGSENRTSSVATNNCYTSHGGGAIIAINGGGSESRVDASAGTGTGGCLAPTGSSKFTLIGTGTFRSESVGAFASSTLASTGGDIVVIGHELLGASTGNSVFAYTATDSLTRIQLARTVLRGSPTNGGSAFAVLGGPRPATIRLFETTMYGAQDQYGEAILLGNVGAARVDLQARGLLIDDYPLWLETLNRAGSILNVRPLILEGYYDDEDLAGGDLAEFLFGAVFPAPSSVMQARAIVYSLGAVDWSLFQGRSRNSNGTWPGTAWLADTAQLRCQPSEACWGAYRARYDVHLSTINAGDPNVSCIPADVLGERVCAFRLRGTHIGARGMPDADRDVLADTTEAAVGSNPTDPDTDDDLLEDGFEFAYGFDPLVPDDSTLDHDGDGIDALAEQDLGSDPRSADSDGDGLRDGFERDNSFDPLAFGDGTSDPDGDYLDNVGEQTHGTDPRAADSDDDGFDDLIEVQRGSDPLDPLSVPPPLVSGLGQLGGVLTVLLSLAVATRRLAARER